MVKLHFGEHLGYYLVEPGSAGACVVRNPGTDKWAITCRIKFHDNWENSAGKEIPHVEFIALHPAPNGGLEFGEPRTRVDFLAARLKSAGFDADATVEEASADIIKGVKEAIISSGAAFTLCPKPERVRARKPSNHA